MNITILNVVISTLPAKKPGGKPYQVAEVAFKNNSYGGNVQGKKITSYSKAWGSVAVAQPGETYDVVTEKNGEFVEWVSMQKGAATAAPSGQTSAATSGFAAAPSRAVGGSSPRSTYETPEERAQRQVFIVRQSSISAAVAALTVGAKSALPAGSVIEMARQFEAYVFETPKVGGETGFDDVPNFDPSFDNQPQID
jgi:hypothetical protein